MINGKKVLAIIPARGGSKGLPGKNIKLLYGKPMIAWTIEESLKSKYIDKLIVSTDSEDIGKTSIQFGAEVPFIRPKELASDSAKSIDVIKHGIDFFENQFKVIILLQPTSPLRTVKDIDYALEEMRRKNVQAVVSVCELEHPIQWVGKLTKDKRMVNFTMNKYKNKNRQELEKHYKYNGALYIADIDYFLENNGFIGNETFAFVMEKEKSVDIDTLFDFKLAEFFFKEKTNERY